MRYSMLLISLLMSPVAFSAPESGISDGTLINYNLTFTASSNSDPELRNGAEICVYASDRKGAPIKSEMVAPRIYRMFPVQRSEGTSPCAVFAHDGERFVSVMNYGTGFFHPAMWNHFSEREKLPLQWTLNRPVRGREVNDAYAKLKEKCHEHSCQDYRLTFAQKSFAIGFGFPVSLDPRGSSWNFDVVRRSSDGTFYTTAMNLNFIE